MVAVLTTLTATAQRKISARVVEGEPKEAVIQATATLLKTDSTMVANALTNAEGRFSMTAPQDGNYIVKVTFVGYKTYTRSIRVANGKDVSLGTITIEPDAIMLKGATVTAQLAKVISKEDTLIYNAGAYMTPEGSVVEDLVRRLPGAEVDNEGNIKINGKEVKKILVDGKEFMTGDTKTAIKNLPTSIIERIKAYDEKSDLSRISGVDDGEEQTVLDFGIKRGMNRGTFGNIDLAVGTRKRYSEKLNVAKFNSKLRIMGMGSMNNVNDMGFSGGRWGGGGRNGQTATKMLGVNINYEEKDKLKASGSLRWNHSNTDAWSRRASENFVSAASSFSNSINQNYSRTNSWNGQARLEWTPDTLWNISFRPTFGMNSNDSKGTSSSASFNDDPYNYVSDPLAGNNLQQLLADHHDMVINSRNSGSLSYNRTIRLGGSLQLNRRLGSRGRNITLRLSANYNDGNSKSMSTSDLTLYQVLSSLGGDSVYQTNRYNLTPSKNWNYAIRTTYSEPIFDGGFLQFSYDFQYRFQKSDRSTYDFWRQWKEGSTIGWDDPNYHIDMRNVAQEYRQWNNYLTLLPLSLDQYLDDDLSRFSQYQNYIHTAEVMFRLNKKTYNFNVGVRVVPQHSHFMQRYQGVETDTTRNVVNWSPTANFRWRINRRGNLRIEYRGNTSQPSMSQLLDIRDDSNPLNISLGNPGLKPSYTQNFNLRFNNYYEKHKRMVYANANFSTTSNAVTNRVEYNPETGGRISKPVNISGAWNAGARFVMNTAIDTTGYFNINTNTSVNYAHSVGYLYKDQVTSKNAVNELTLGERLGGSYRNDWFEFEVSGGVTYRHARNELQPSSNLDTWAFSYGFNTTVQLPWGMQLTTDLNMSSRRGYSDSNLNTNELLWNAQISQSFLKGKPLAVTLQFYDILNRQSNLTRTINAMSRTDNEYNAINSYVMLHAIYRFNLFGTKEARRQMRERQQEVESDFREGRPEGGNRGGRGNRGGGGGFGGGGFGGGFGGGGRF